MTMAVGGLLLPALFIGAIVLKLFITPHLFTTSRNPASTSESRPGLDDHVVRYGWRKRPRPRNPTVTSLLALRPAG
jgi:hypothetical protein